MNKIHISLYVPTRCRAFKTRKLQTFEFAISRSLQSTTLETRPTLELSNSMLLKSSNVQASKPSILELSNFHAAHFFHKNSNPRSSSLADVETMDLWNCQTLGLSDEPANRIWRENQRTFQTPNLDTFNPPTTACQPFEPSNSQALELTTASLEPLLLYQRC